MDAPITLTWTLDPSVLLGLAAFALAYAFVARRSSAVSRAQILAFVVAVATLVVALVSPLDELSDHALFSAHMLQHLLLLFVVPALVLYAVPDEVFRAIGRVSLSRWIVKLLGSPIPAFLISTAVLWIWHTPSIYEAALRSEPLHALEHLSFLITGTLYWWPVVRHSTYPWPVPELLRIVYLFGGAVSSTMLAALLTFASTVLYPTYAETGFAAAVHAALNMSPLADQEAGGLAMWIVGSLWYLTAAGIVFYRWFEGPGEDLPSAESPYLKDNGVIT